MNMYELITIVKIVKSQLDYRKTSGNRNEINDL